MTKYLTLIFKNLRRSKRRTILTILSIAVSLFIFSVLVSLPTFANQMLADTTSSVRIICRTKMGLGYPLPLAYKSKIATIPHVVEVAPLVIYGGIYHEASDQFPSVATEAKEIDMWSDWGITGMDDFKKIKTACLVADGTMRRFNLHVGQQIQLRGTVFPFNVTLNIRWMIHEWCLKSVPRLITNSPIRRRKHEVFLKQRQLAAFWVAIVFS